MIALLLTVQQKLNVLNTKYTNYSHTKVKHFVLHLKIFQSEMSLIMTSWFNK